MAADQTTLFLANLAAIDHAYIDIDGSLIGNSIRPYFEVFGINDPVEQVVIDSSKLKKSIDSILADDETGLDHKLFVFEDSPVTRLVDEDHQRVKLVGTKFIMDLPLDAVHFIDRSVRDYQQSIESYLCEFVLDSLGEKEVNQISLLTCRIDSSFALPPLNLDDDEDLDCVVVPFAYTHGLKNSTAFGCQSPVHGHLSYLALFLKDGAQQLYEEDTDKIKEALDGSVFINIENVKHIDAKRIDVGYYTERGFFSVSYARTADSIKFHIIDNETTVENLAFVVKNLLRETLGSLSRIKSMYISEGLDKGSFILN